MLDKRIYIESVTMKHFVAVTKKLGYSIIALYLLYLVFGWL